MFRLLFISFFGGFRGTEEQRMHIHESPAAMTVPLVVLAVLSVIGGFVGIPEVFMHGGEMLTQFLSPVIAPPSRVEVTHSTELLLMALTTIVAVVAIAIAWMRYKNYREEQPTAIGKFLQNKWYVDELYDRIIVRPVMKLGVIANNYFERSGIDAMVNGVGKMVNYGSRQLRWLQSGQIGSYVLLMVVSMLLFFLLQFFLRK